MYFTPYLTVHRHADIVDQVLLFSTKTGALVLLPEEDYAALQNGEKQNDYVSQLTEMGFLVADQEEERQQVNKYLEEINLYNPNLTLAIILGMECNFACRYCFEGEQKGKKDMDDQTADQLIAFIKERFTTGKKKLILQLYGGSRSCINNVLFIWLSVSSPLLKKGAESFVLIWSQTVPYSLQRLWMS